MRTPALLALLLAAACNNPSTTASTPGDLPRTGEALATVSGKPVTQATLDAILSTLPEQVAGQLKEPAQFERFKDQVLTEEALYQAALTAKLHEDPTIKTKLAVSQRQTLANAYVEQELAKRMTDEAVQAWFEKNADKFGGAQAQLSAIAVESEADAKAIKAELDGGADFAALAQAKSIDSRSKDKGGDMGWVGKRQLPPPLHAAFDAPKGTVLDPINAGGKWSVLKVNDTRSGPPLDEVREQVEKAMKTEVARAFVEEIKATAVTSATVAAPTGAPAGG